MELTNEFTVPLPPDRAWAVLTDLERVAPCLPGARLTEIEGDEHRGEVKVKVGPITATYKGVARFVERDAGEHRAVLQAEGSDVRQGNATATVTATLAPDGTGTRVTIDTDLSVGGKVAQFGRGVFADVSVKILDQFAECLSEQLEAEQAEGVDTLLDDLDPSPAVVEFAKAVVEARPDEASGDQAPADGDAAEQASAEDGRPVAAGDTGPRRIDSPEPQPLDLVGAAGPPLARRLLPVGGLLAALLAFILLRRRRR